jgi:hypothetical protein
MNQIAAAAVAFGLLGVPLSAADFQVTSLTGTALVGASPKNYAAPKLNVPYPLGSWAKTGAGSSMVFVFSPQNIFRLLPSSELQVNGSGEAHSGFRRVLQLKAGSVDLDLKALPKGTSIQVETPTAVCGAVGTSFSVNADEGKYNVSEGRIFAKASGDSGFEARSVSGSFTLAPGKENAFHDANVSGSFVVNGVAMNGSASLQIAKARGGTGKSAVRVRSGTVGGRGRGAYLMEGGALVPVAPDLVPLHGQYLAAAQKEGGLRVALSTGAGGSPASLNAAAAKATALREQLFNRRVIRDTVRDSVSEIARPRPHH